MLAHAATPDSTLLSFTVLTFYLFWIGSRNEGRAWFVPCGMAAGLAALTKGPVGVVVPCAVIFFYLLWNRELKRLLDRRIFSRFARSFSGGGAVVYPGHGGNARRVDFAIHRPRKLDAFCQADGRAVGAEFLSRRRHHYPVRCRGAFCSALQSGTPSAKPRNKRKKRRSRPNNARHAVFSSAGWRVISLFSRSPRRNCRITFCPCTPPLRF